MARKRDQDNPAPGHATSLPSMALLVCLLALAALALGFASTTLLPGRVLIASAEVALSCALILSGRGHAKASCSFAAVAAVALIASIRIQTADLALQSGLGCALLLVVPAALVRSGGLVHRSPWAAFLAQGLAMGVVCAALAEFADALRIPAVADIPLTLAAVLLGAVTAAAAGLRLHAPSGLLPMLLCGIGWMGLLSWCIPSPVLAGGAAGLRVMPLGAVLAMLLAGFALRALSGRRIWLALVPGLVWFPLAVSALTANTVGRTDLIAPAVVFSSFAETPLFAQARLSSLTAFALLGLLVAIPIVAHARRRPAWWSVVWMLGLLISGLGLLGVAVVVLGSPSWQIWGAHLAISLPASLGLVALGVGLAALNQPTRWESNLRTFVLPAGVGMVMSILSVLLWYALAQRQMQMERRMLDSERRSIATALRDGMYAQVTAIRRVAKRFSVLDASTRLALFPIDADQYLNDITGLRALGYLDARRVLRATLARPGPDLDLGTAMDDAPERRRIFDAADATGEVRLSEPLPLLVAGEGELIVAPVQIDGRTTGYVVGVVQFERLFHGLLAAHQQVDNLRVVQGGVAIFSRGHVVTTGESQPLPIELYGQHWQIEVGREDQVRNRLPMLVMLLGLVLAGLIAVALRLSALARERARYSARVSLELRQQVIAKTEAQDALSSVQHEMAMVLKSITDGVFMVDMDWRFTYVNPCVAAMVGSSPVELVGESCWDWLPDAMDDGAEHGSLHLAWTQAIAQREPVTLNASHLASQQLFELRAYPHEHGLTVYVQDVSLRKRQERELLKRDAESRHAQQLAQLGSWEFHIRSGDLHWSAETCAIFGVECSPGAEGIEGLRARIHPDDWAEVMAAQDRILRGNGMVEVEYRVLRPDGEVRVVHQLGELLANDGDPLLAGAVQDITERQRIEEALRNTGDELGRALEATRLVMDSAPDVIVVLDRDGRFQQISAAAERLWGHAPETLLGDSIMRVVHADDREATMDVIADMAAGHPRTDFRNRNLTRDGHVLHMQWSGAWSDQSRCLYVVGRDYSELHRAEAMDASQRAILTAIANGQPLARVLESIVRAYEAQHPDALCSVLLLRDGHMYHGAAPHLPRHFLKAIDGAPIGPEAGSCGTAAWRGERVVVTDIATDPLWESYAALALPHGLLACWSTPILARDGVVLGTFAVYHGESRAPTADELSGVDSLAALAAIAIEHDQAFRQLSESEQRFRSLFDNHPDGVLALDAPGRILQANPAAATLLGNAAADLQGQRLVRHAAESDRARVEAAVAGASSGEPERRDVLMASGDGEPFAAHLVTIPMVTEGGSHGLFAVLQDHRALQRAQHAMAGQLALLSAIADSVGEGLLAVDSAGRPTFVNRMASRLLELPAYGLPGADALPAEVDSALQAVLVGSGFVSNDDASFELGRSHVLPVAYVATPLHIEGHLAGAVLAFRDIGDLKAARKSLSERQRFFDLSLEVFCIFDPESGHFVQVNPAFCRLLGYQEDVLRGLPLEDMIHPQDLLATQDAARWQQESGELLSEFFNRVRCADGSYVWLEWVSRLAPEGLVFAVARDVTAKHHADASLAQAMDDLRIRNRELQDFAYVASHDLQEPLRKIQAFSDRLQSRLREVLDASSRDYLQRMGDAASRMQTLIDDLLAYSRVGTRAVEPAAVDLAAELVTVLDDLDTRIQEAGAAVEVAALPTLQADASQMRQLLQNLLTNALKFRSEDRPCRIRLSAQALGEGIGPVERWEIRVQDNGIGFDPAYAERIFAPFQRLHPRNIYAGTGIGLAIVRRIVERHGGTIHAESESGKGTSFFIRLPVRASKGLLRANPDAPMMNTDLSGASS